VVLGHDGELSRAVALGLECGALNASRIEPGCITEPGQQLQLL